MPSTLSGSSLIEADDRIQRAAQSALRATGYRPLAKLDCSVRDGVVVLSGIVPSYYLKQVAQETVLRLNVAFGIENSVVVQRN